MANNHRWFERLRIIEHQYRPNGWYIYLLMLVAFCLGGLCYYLLMSQEQTGLALGGGKVKRLQQELAQQQQLLATRDLQLAVEKEANAEMQKMFSEQAVKQRELERDLTLYKAVVAPNESAEGVTVHGMELLPSTVPGQQKIKVILTQIQKKKQTVRGNVQIVLLGAFKDGKRETLSLSEVGGKLEDFDFKYYQVLETPVTLPAGFELNSIKATLKVRKSRHNQSAEAEQIFSLPSLTGEAKEPGIILEQNSQVTDNSAQ